MRIIHPWVFVIGINERIKYRLEIIVRLEIILPPPHFHPQPTHHRHRRGGRIGAEHSTSDSTKKYGFSGAMFYNANPPANPSFDDHGQAPLINHFGSIDGQIFPEIRSFNGFMASSDNAMSMADIPTTSYKRILEQAPPAADHPGSEVEFKMQDMSSSEKRGNVFLLLIWATFF